GRRRAQRRTRLHARRPGHRPHRAARALRQRLLRRTAPQPALHGGGARALRALREHAGSTLGAAATLGLSSSSPASEAAGSSPASSMRRRPASIAFIFLLGALSALPATATDMALPALTDIAASLQTSVSN